MTEAPAPDHQQLERWLRRSVQLSLLLMIVALIVLPLTCQHGATADDAASTGPRPVGDNGSRP